MPHDSLAYPSACFAESLINLDHFQDGLITCANGLLATHAELVQECHYISDLQRWLLSHMTVGIAFEHMTNPSLPPLTATILITAFEGTNIASRNTIKAYLREMLRYGYLTPLATGDRRVHAVQTTDMSKYLIWRYIEIHLRALDAIDGAQRVKTLKKHPQLLFHAHPCFARELLAQQAWYEPPNSIVRFARSNSGSSLLHELVGRISLPSLDTETPIWVGNVVPTALAKRYGISKTHVASLLSAAKREGFIGWTKTNNQRDWWVSSQLVADYRAWQALKLATIAKAFWDACEFLGIESRRIYRSPQLVRAGSMTSKTASKFSPEVRASAVRMVAENEAEYPSRWAAVSSIAAKIGCSAHTLNEWVKKAEVDSSKQADLPSEAAERIKMLERENRELRQANEILRKASDYFAQAGHDHPLKR